MPDPTDPPPADPDLVAYLDGELPPDAARQVQDKLSADPYARREAEALKKTFDLLDHLPRPAPSPTFTSRTLTKLGTPPPASQQPTTALSAHGSAPVPPPVRRPRFWLVGWGVAAAVAAGLGYFGHLLARPHLAGPAAAPAAVEQVRLLERLPLYLGVDDLAFARRLDDPELFAEPDSTPGPAAPEDAVTSAELAKLDELFRRFPTARQQQLRRLDEELQAADPPARERTLGVIERYAVWLDRLPDGYRREVLAAPSPDERLDAVRRVKARAWRDALPPAARAKFAAAEPDERERLANDRKRRDADRAALWAAARRHWKDGSGGRPWPFTSDELSRQVNDYVDKVLRPRLSPTERTDLDELKAAAPASGLGAFNFGWAVYRLTESHPPLPPAADGKPMVTTIEELRRLDQPLWRNLTGGLKAAGKKPKDLIAWRDAPQAGKWPEFALHVLDEAKAANLTPKGPLGPSRPAEYAPPVAAFLATDLDPKLDAKERAELRGLEGKWPEHSRKLMDLARKHDLPVPGVTLPGSPRQWAETYDPRRRK